jgi:hypothetical protein
VNGVSSSSSKVIPNLCTSQFFEGKFYSHRPFGDLSNVLSDLPHKKNKNKNFFKESGYLLDDSGISPNDTRTDRTLYLTTPSHGQKKMPWVARMAKIQIAICIFAMSFFILPCHFCFAMPYYIICCRTTGICILAVPFIFCRVVIIRHQLQVRILNFCHLKEGERINYYIFTVQSLPLIRFSY